MTEKLRVYTAGKIPDGPMFMRLRDEWPEIEFTARWPFQLAAGLPDEPAFAKVFWEQDQEDVEDSNAILVYIPNQTDRARGALVEVGIAIANQIPVVLVGDHPDYGTWQYHALVHRVVDLKQARMLLKAMALDYTGLDI